MVSQLAGTSYRAARTDLLLGFFQRLATLLASRYGMHCLDEAFRDGELERWVYNREFCSTWFNNLDRIPGQPHKHLFGSFFHFGDDTYLFHLMAGSTNLHVGLVKYARSGDDYQLLPMAAADFDATQKRYGARLPEGIALVNRTWGYHYRWVSIDCGNFIDLRNAEVFAAMVEPERSRLFQHSLLPLLRALKEAAP